MTTQRKATTTNPSDIPDSIPLFLKKTYHMIDSCDPTVAGWSEDGETFVVKDPAKFESEIIPQFFKHSKFASFVRQLNFYSFRKIKYVDTIRLDPKLEAENANFWRFKHDKFQRGQPHLLTQIKRMTASQTRAAAEKAAKADAAASSSVVAITATGKSTADSAMKQEIDTLKKRLEEMNRNMNELTSMVQQVSLKDSTTDHVQAGNKRKKVEFSMREKDLPESVLSETAIEELYYDNLSPASSNEMDAVDAAFGMPMPARQPPTRASSTASNMTDSDFVDQLFDVFGRDEPEETHPEPVVIASATPVSRSYNDNRPDPQLMERLSEALAVLPKSMQEQIVNRLIDNITSNAMTTQGSAVVVPGYNQTEKDEDDYHMMDQVVLAHQPQTPEHKTFEMPLAAATLASLLNYYSNLVKQQEEEDGKAHKTAVKSIPVIPCHA